MLKTLIERLLTGLFYVLPHHLISRIVLTLSHSQAPWISKALIRLYTAVFPLNLAEAVEPSKHAYPSLNALFTRALRSDARPIANESFTLISPADGILSEFGTLHGDQLMQAKGYHYSLQKLFAEHAQLSDPFIDGGFATIYLSPRDYHRLHMPITGKLTDMIYIPGRLFSVSPMTTRNIPEIFTRNERLVCVFDTEIGKIALVLVGAINVAAIETVWAGLVTPPRGKVPQHTHYDNGVVLQRGEEMGRFNMGSTVIVLTEKDSVLWLDEYRQSASIQLGNGLAKKTA